MTAPPIAAPPIAAAPDEAPGEAPDQTLRRAAALHQAGDGDGAFQSLQELLRRLPGFPSAWFMLALMRANNGDAPGAVRALRRVLALRPDWAEAVDSLGGVEQRCGRLAAAAGWHRRAAALHPDLAQAWNNLGTVRARMGDPSARTAFRIAACLDPADVLCLHNLGKLDEQDARAHGDKTADETATRCYRRAVFCAPSFAPSLANLGNFDWRRGRPEAALIWLERALAANPQEVGALNTLVMTLADLGREEEAQARGAELLTLKDAASRAQFPAFGVAPAPSGGKARGEKARRVKGSLAKGKRAGGPAAARRNLDVISFSLWGDRPVYTQGAVANVTLAAALYPGWRCRFYVDDSVPPTVLERLRALGAEIVRADAQTRTLHGGLWRFLAADDPKVRRFICRDCDSRLNTQEQAAVAQWLASGAPFHLMRDHLYHCELMLAGMWGGTAGVLPPLAETMFRWFSGDGDRWSDQRFLAAVVWPQIRHRCLIHDSCWRLFGAVDFPERGRLIRPDHVGGDAPPDETAGL